MGLAQGERSGSESGLFPKAQRPHQAGGVPLSNRCNLCPGCEDSFALLFHSLENTPFEHEEHRRCLREWGLAPDPKSLHDGAEDEECTTEVEEEDSFPPPGWGCPGHAVGLDNPPSRQFRRRHSNLSHPPGSSCLHSVLLVAKDPTIDLPPVIVSRKWLKGGGQPSRGEGRWGSGAPLGVKQGY